MNQENQNRMTASAGKSSFTCKQPSVCKWPINWWEPDVPVYSRCLPSCPAFDGLIDGTGLQQRGCCLPGRKPSLSQPWQFLSPAYLLLFPEKDIPLVNEVKDGPLAMNEVTQTQKPDPPHPTRVHALVPDVLRELQHHQHEIKCRTEEQRSFLQTYWLLIFKNRKNRNKRY